MEIKPSDINTEYILKNLPAYVLLIDKGCNIYFINKVADYAEISQVLGSNVSLFLNENEYQRLQKSVKDVFETNKPTKLDIKYNEVWKNRQYSLHLIPYEQVGCENKFLLAVNIDNQLQVDARIESELNEFKFKKIVENLPDSVFQVDENLNIVYHNRLKTIPAEKRKTLIGQSIFKFVSDEKHIRLLKEQMALSVSTGEAQVYEIEGKDELNGLRWFQGNCIAIMKEGVNTGFIIHSLDITKRKLEQAKSEQFNHLLEDLVSERTLELEKANQEITVLLQEMHHRVKNNLQIINSLLSLQSQFVENESKETLQLCQNRIQSMALVHEMLYNNERLSSVSIQEYIQTLARNHIVNYPGSFPIDYNIVVLTETEHIDIGVMITIGLLINELIANTIKHAFGSTLKPAITIELISLPKTSDYNTQLIYKDNGKGVLLKEVSEGMGSLLIESFIGQLDGQYETKESKQGVYYLFLFDL